MSGEKTVMVGGAPMYPSKNIVENAVNSKDHTTLVAAVKAAGLVDTLSGQGPFTVFAPTNAAFAKLPAGTVETLVKPENKADADQDPDLSRRPGPDRRRLPPGVDRRQGDAQDRRGRTDRSSRRAARSGRSDAKGGMSTVTIADVMQSNGVIHVVDTVLMPRNAGSRKRKGRRLSPSSCFLLP